MEPMSESVTSRMFVAPIDPVSAPVTQTAPQTTPQVTEKPPLPISKVDKKETSVWAFYEKIEVVENDVVKLFAKCSLCSQLLVRGGQNGTSHLRRHWLSHISNQAEDSSQSKLATDSSGNISKWSYSKDIAKQEVVEYVVRAEHPFTFVDKHDFKGLIQRAFAPQYGGISASTCQREVMKQYDTGRKELVKFFESYQGLICLTSDCWSSRQKMGYMSLTAHFIDKKWKLNKRIITFKMIEYPHSGESLAHHINEELISWRIHRKIFSLSLDNATSNDVVAQILPDLLMLNSVLRKFFHVRCNAHVSNLIVQDGLFLLSPSVEKITNIVRSMNSSIKRHELWLNCCEDLNMPKRNIDIDVPHRWNSTYDLLQLAETYKFVLNRYVQKLNQSNRHSTLALPTDEDWLIATILCRFLKVFYTSTKIVCGVYYPTSCRVIPCLVRINAAFNKYARYPVIASALVAMKSKFSKYYKTFPPIFCLAAFMDPRYKLFALSQWMKSMDLHECEIDTAISNVKQQLFELHEVYKHNVVLVVPSSTISSNSQASSDCTVLPNDDDFAEEVLKKAKTATSTSSSSTSDLQYYIDMPCLEVPDGLEFNLLGWWRSHEEVYPVLSLMARDLLAVPASTVASEAAFSVGGRVVSEKRASLNPSTIQALICSKDWKLAEKRLQDKEQEELVAEEERIAKLARPEWMVTLERDVPNTDEVESVGD